MDVTRRVRTAACIAAVLALACGASPSYAQNNNTNTDPSVLIDTSILDALNPSARPSETVIPDARPMPSRERDVRPALQPRQRPSLTAPAAQAPVAPIVFPIETRVRTDSLNPAAAPARAVPAPSPHKKPNPAQARKVAAQDMPPLPKRPPRREQLAGAATPSPSASMAAKKPAVATAQKTDLRNQVLAPIPAGQGISKGPPSNERNLAKTAPLRVPLPDKDDKKMPASRSTGNLVLSGPKAGPKMPSVKPTKVSTEILHESPALERWNTPELEGQLLTPNREELVKTVESISKASEAYARKRAGKAADGQGADSTAARQAMATVPATRLEKRDERQPLFSKEEKEAAFKAVQKKAALDATSAGADAHMLASMPRLPSAKESIPQPLLRAPTAPAAPQEVVRVDAAPLTQAVATAAVPTAQTDKHEKSAPKDSADSKEKAKKETRREKKERAADKRAADKRKEDKKAAEDRKAEKAPAKQKQADANAIPAPAQDFRLIVEQAEGQERIVLPFAPRSDDLARSLQEALKKDVLPLLQTNPDWKVQIQAFADKNQGALGDDKRISLARALTVRSWLMDQGVEPGRVDVRAFGRDDGNRSPADRVDLLLVDSVVR